MAVAVKGSPLTSSKENLVDGTSEYVPFGTVLRDLLIARGVTTGVGNVNWRAFAELVDGVHYETLRKAVTGEREPTPETMERVAQALELEPTIFVEYRLWQAKRMFDPREVGSEAALDALEEWAALQNKKRRTR